MDSSSFDIDIVVINGHRFIDFGFGFTMWVLAAWKREEQESSNWHGCLRGA